MDGMRYSLENKRMDKINIEKINSVYEQPKSLKEYKRYQREKFLDKCKENEYFNGLNARLVDYKNKDGEVSLLVEDVLYEDYLTTNLYYKNNVYDLLLKDKFMEEHKEDMGNQIGTSGVIVTLDGSYVFRERSNKVMKEKGKIDTSFSGTLSGLKTGTLEDNLDQMVYKEMEEELGIKSHEIEKIMLQSFYKDKTQLDKPEFLFYITVNLKDDDIEDRYEESKDHWESNKIDFVKNIDDIEEYKHKGKEITINVMEFINTIR